MKILIIAFGFFLAALMTTALVIAGRMAINSRLKEKTDPRTINNEGSSLKTGAAKSNVISISFDNQLAIVITDPLGRNVELEPTGKMVIQEIPGSHLGVPGSGEYSDTIEYIIDAAESGDYLITVTVMTEDMKNYSMEIRARNSNHDRLTRCFENIPTFQGAMNKYLFHFNSENMKKCIFKGGYSNDREQSTSAKYLTFANPIHSVTKLPPGISSFPLIIFYDFAIIPNTFKAKLNDAVISNLFRKNPGGWETVILDMRNGKNTVSFLAEGLLENKIGMDIVILTIIAEL